MTQYDKALEIAKVAHQGQVDKAGEPYILHPIAVAEMVKSDEAKIVALLHDVVEDSEVTIESIRKGFGDNVADAVELLTRRNKREGYLKYIARLAANPIAREVKLADITHNTDPKRLAKLKDKGEARALKYAQARKILDGSMEGL